MFPQEPVPDRIGAYQVLKCVGRSGAADIYVARAEGPMGFSRDVTLKMVRYAIDEDARFAEELSREAAICSRLNHPVVVRMFDFFEHDRRLVLVLEQVEGASLDRLQSHLVRRKQKLADNAIFYVGMQLATALAHAHGSSDEDGNLSPVIHRDIKPENVLIGWDGAIRLAGFGLGKILGRTPDSVAGTIRGTPGYMSPEQARGERATVRSDVYGFGVLLWSLLTGMEPPLDGVKPQALSEVRPDLPRELHMAVDAALEPSPDKRRITCAEIAQWLSKLTKVETGREELRQKVLWLRATRGPTSKVDPSNKTVARQPKRRQALQATRSRRTSRPPSSVRAGPASSRPLRSTSEFPSSPPSSSRAVQVREGSGLLRIPPPPPLPHDSDAPTRQHTLPMAESPFAQPPPAPTFGAPPQAPPKTIRPAGVNVRTVSTPPPRSVPPLRPVLSAEDMLAAAPDTWRAEGLGSQSPPPERLTDAVSTYDSQPNQGAITARPHVPQQPTFTLTTQVLLAGLTAALVVTVGLLFLQRSQPTQMPPQVFTVEVSRPAEPPREPLREVVPAKAAEVAPPAPPTAAALAAPLPPQMPDPSTLTDGMGYLMVKGPANADVYLNGQRKGPTNEPLMVPCGQFFMRLAPPNQPKFPSWLGPGESTFVSCKSSTVLIAKPVDTVNLSGTKM